MHPLRRRRLLWVVALVVISSVGVGLIVYALRSNMNLFYPPSEVVAGEAPLDTPVRVGGMVVPDSVRRDSDSLRVRFDVTDYEATVTVVYEGILPDLFAEGEGAVAAGTLDADRVLHADQVLAKHDENYMPPEVRDSLKGGDAPR